MRASAGQVQALAGLVQVLARPMRALAGQMLVLAGQIRSIWQLATRHQPIMVRLRRGHLQVLDRTLAGQRTARLVILLASGSPRQEDRGHVGT